MNYNRRINLLTVNMIFLLMLILFTIVIASSRNRERMVIQQNLFHLLTEIQELSISITNFRTYSPLKDSYPKWKESSDEVIKDIDIVLDQIDSPGITQQWMDINATIELVDSRLLKLKDSDDLLWNKGFWGSDLSETELYNGYLRKESLVGIELLDFNLNSYFEENLDQLYRDTIKQHSRDQYLTTVVSSLISLISIILIYLSSRYMILLTRRHIDTVNGETQKAKDITIQALVHQSDLKDHETGEHIVRTAQYVEFIASEMSNYGKYRSILSEEYISDIKSSAPLHDIGKVGIPDKILSKPGSLTSEEFDVMKEHTVMGASTLRKAINSLSGNNYLKIAIDLIESHHENWDGSGYPHGLKGEDIPLAGRIMALADVYDALRSKRVYKEPFDHEKCKKIVLNELGKKFDPDVVKAFLKVEELFKNMCYDSEEECN